MLLFLLFLSAIDAYGETQQTPPCYGADELIVATVLRSSEKEVSKLLTRVVNVTLEAEVEAVEFSKSGLRRGAVIRVICTRRFFGDETPSPPRCVAGQRLRMHLRRFETGESFRPACAEKSFVALEE